MELCESIVTPPMQVLADCSDIICPKTIKNQTQLNGLMKMSFAEKIR